MNHRMNLLQTSTCLPLEVIMVECQEYIDLVNQKVSQLPLEEN